MEPTIHIPPGTPAPLRAAISAAERTLDQHYALFGNLAREVRHTLPPLPQLTSGGLQSELITTVRAQLQQRQNGIHSIDAQITALSSTQIPAISAWGTQQITAIVTELNQRLDAVGNVGGSHGHGGHGEHSPSPHSETQMRIARDLDDALSAVWRVVQQASDKANHTSGTVTDHSHRMRQHAAPAYAVPDQPQASQPQPAQPQYSPYSDGYCVGNQYVSGLTDEDRTCYDGSMA